MTATRRKLNHFVIFFFYHFLSSFFHLIIFACWVTSYTSPEARPTSAFYDADCRVTPECPRQGLDNSKLPFNSKVKPLFQGVILSPSIFYHHSCQLFVGTLHIYRMGLVCVVLTQSAMLLLTLSAVQMDRLQLIMLTMNLKQNPIRSLRFCYWQNFSVLSEIIFHHVSVKSI